MQRCWNTCLANPLPFQEPSSPQALSIEAKELHRVALSSLIGALEWWAGPELGPGWKPGWHRLQGLWRSHYSSQSWAAQYTDVVAQPGVFPRCWRLILDMLACLLIPWRSFLYWLRGTQPGPHAWHLFNIDRPRTSPWYSVWPLPFSFVQSSRYKLIIIINCFCKKNIIHWFNLSNSICRQGNS